ncbi:gp53-like domain-containing protein [Haemophilus parainfluenzae]|uniref:gp53-like domain-containing protein n=1 Tax=Haemophilus parainfluenzae TaxID=729 RepID=UPI001FB2EB3B|nr:tail fiber protein [Haemophilus parainfluenzae]
MKTLLPEINSADKRFHAGNPATGEQGTRVTDTWLNDVQDRVRDVQAEAHYVLLKAGFTPNAETQTQLYQAIVKIIDDNRKSASVTQKGEVKLTSDTGLDSEDLGLTAKAGKVLAKGIADLRLAMNNYIPLKSRSSSVTSNDENGAATPKAVKIAYDKGVDAKEAADNANNNANGRVSKSGDRLTGILYSVGISSKHFGYGAYANQYTSGAPFMVETTGSQDRDTYHPFVKGLVRSKGRYGAGFSFGYTTKQGQGDGFGRGIIHLIEDNGANRLWAFEHNGDFNSAGDVRSSSGKSLNNSVQTSDYRSQWGQTGWVKLPNGLILQWGKTPVIHDENSTDIVFPIAFPNKVLNIQLTENQMRTVNNHATHLAALNVTNSKFTFKINSTLSIDSSADWFAIGY